MSAHDPELHDRLLGEILVTDAPEQAFEASELAQCELCAAEFWALVDLQKGMDLTGHEERDSLERIRVDGDSVEADRVEEILRPHLVQPKSPARRRILLAAAVLFAVSLGIRWFAGFGDETQGIPDIIMGTSSADLVEPIGDVEEFRTFRWTTQVQEGDYFLVEVFAASQDSIPESLARSGRIHGQEWQPEQEDVATWPGSIQWELRVFDSNNSRLDTLFGYARRSSR